MPGSECQHQATLGIWALNQGLDRSSEAVSGSAHFVRVHVCTCMCVHVCACLFDKSVLPHIKKGGGEGRAELLPLQAQLPPGPTHSEVLTPASAPGRPGYLLLSAHGKSCVGGVHITQATTQWSQPGIPVSVVKKRTHTPTSNFVLPTLTCPASQQPPRALSTQPLARWQDMEVQLTFTMAPLCRLPVSRAAGPDTLVSSEHELRTLSFHGYCSHIMSSVRTNRPQHPGQCGVQP